MVSSALILYTHYSLSVYTSQYNLVDFLKYNRCFLTKFVKFIRKVKNMTNNSETLKRFDIRSNEYIVKFCKLYYNDIARSKLGGI